MAPRKQCLILPVVVSVLMCSLILPIVSAQSQIDTTRTYSGRLQVTQIPLSTSTPPLLSIPGYEKESELVTSLWIRYGWYSLPIICGLLVLAGIVYFAVRIVKQPIDKAADAVGKEANQWLKDVPIIGSAKARMPAYLAGLKAQFTWLDLSPITENRMLEVGLRAVYIPLLGRIVANDISRSDQLLDIDDVIELHELVHDRTKDRQLTTLVGHNRNLIIVGPAGSGKTTFLYYTVLSFVEAIETRVKASAPIMAQFEWQEDAIKIPVFIPLGGMASFVKSDKAAKNLDTSNPQLIIDYLHHYYRDQDLPEDFFSNLISNGSCIVLLDGLDEIADEDLRIFVAGSISQLARTHANNHYVLTTRPEVLIGKLQLGEFTVAQVEAIRWREIKGFIHGLYSELSARGYENLPENRRSVVAEADAKDLTTRLRSDRSLRQFANNPLLLTIIIVIHYTSTEIPTQRTKLYQRCIEILLSWDRIRVSRGTRPLLDAQKQIELSVEVKQQILETLAFYMQEHRLIEFLKQDTKEFLESVLGNYPHSLEQHPSIRAERLLDWYINRSYLLRESGPYIHFLHRDFQDYLAAKRIAARDDYAMLCEQLADDKYWESTIALLTSHLSSNSVERTQRLVGTLTAPEKLNGNRNQRLILTGYSLSHSHIALLGSIVNLVRDQLADVLLQKPPLVGVIDRTKAGDALGILGDPRPLNQHILIPDGFFPMGCKPDEVEFWKSEIERQLTGRVGQLDATNFGDLIPSLQEWLDAECDSDNVLVGEYTLAKYPITNRLFEQFVEDNGYKEPKFWTKAGWEWITHMRRIADGGQQSEPLSLHDPLLGGSNQPVVGVAWYEAVAFCRWHTVVLTDRGEIPKDWIVRLPTEPEWEKAASYDPAKQQKTRWPWGDEWEKDRANTEDSLLSRTTPVGIYTDGESHYGVSDMSGNCWEWCSTKWAERGWEHEYRSPYASDDGRENIGGAAPRIVKGGAWNLGRIFARTTAKRRYSPETRDSLIGFRIVMAHRDSLKGWQIDV